MENTLENKAKFFAQYYMQNVFMKTPNSNTWPLNYTRIGSITSHSCLQLRPLSSITDDEAIKVFDILFPETGYTDEVKIDLVKSWVLLINKETGGFLPKNYVTFIDYLRGKSFLLPFHNLSTEQIIAYGWAKSN